MDEKTRLKQATDILNFWRMEDFLEPQSFPTNNNKNNAYKFYTEDDVLNFSDFVSKKIPKDKLNEKRIVVIFGNYYLRPYLKELINSIYTDEDQKEEKENLLAKMETEISYFNSFSIFTLSISCSDFRVKDYSLQISPFFFLCEKIIKAKSANIAFDYNNVETINMRISLFLSETEKAINTLSDISEIAKIVFDELDLTDRYTALKQRNEKYGIKDNNKKRIALKIVNNDDNDDTIFFKFYASDLRRALDILNNNETLLNYVTALTNDDTNKIMIDTDINKLSEVLKIKNYPLAKYPSKHNPSLMQQVAINIATKEDNEPIFSVNGPPGTGKTTLLKEIIANNVEKTAEELIKLEEKKYVWSSCKCEDKNGDSKTYYKVPGELAKYNILVVSNNNAAVENISAELPKKKSVSKDNSLTEFFDVGLNPEVYFTDMANFEIKEGNINWGLISSPVGSQANFKNTLKKINFNGTNIEKLKEANKFKTLSEATEYFKQVQAKVLEERNKIEKDEQTLESYRLVQEEYKALKLELEEAILENDDLCKQIDDVSTRIINFDKLIADLTADKNKRKKDACLLRQIFCFFQIGKLYQELSKIDIDINGIEDRREVKEREKENLKFKLNGLEAKLSLLKNKLDEKQKELLQKEKAVVCLKQKYKEAFPDDDFFFDITKNESSQRSCPWLPNAENNFNKYREELFFAALQVRKMYILEHSEYFVANINLFEQMYKANADMINTLQLIVPVISSTFASVGNFLENISSKQLGTLIIDEAGQATPYSAVGAIFRTQKAIVVGDPLQVEPIVTIPKVLTRICYDKYQVPDKYINQSLSVQSFADKANKYNGKLGDTQVGCPLVVHRRCLDPMFSISNKISYDNRMFNGTTNTNHVSPPSAFIDIKGKEKGNGNHFVEEQGDYVLSYLKKYYPNGIKAGELFIITPFTTVASELISLLKKYDEYEKWSNINNISTVHRFQGKEATNVLFVLGCDYNSQGAIDWVCAKPNIINVAVTRAKCSIQIIGDYNIWKNKNYFRDFVPNILKLQQSQNKSSSV